MCGIIATSKTYDGSMYHRGLQTKSRQIGPLEIVHEHLPIQADITDDPFIETDGLILFFNGEFFTECENDFEFIKLIMARYGDNPDLIHNHLVGIDGFFSVIMIDKKSPGRIYAFTDLLGKKQLYYDGYAIASELRPLNKGPYNPLHLSRTIKFGYVTDASTPYLNIIRLEPGMIYDINLYEGRIHYIGEPATQYVSESRKDSLYNLIDKSVENRLKGHESIALLLSGGLDSSIIYHHASNHVDVKTYCWPNESDFEFAEMIDPNVELLDPADANLEDALIAMEMPLDLGSMVAQYQLFRTVRERVILTGDGADEIFGGYRRMNVYDAQYSDIFDELVYYHNVRIDRMSMIHTKEARSPFMNLDVLNFGLSLSHSDRLDKRYLRDEYSGHLPDEIVNRKKEALKSDAIRRQDPIIYRAGLVRLWKELNNDR